MRAIVTGQIGMDKKPYLRAVCDRLGLISYAGDIGGPALQRG